MDSEQELEQKITDYSMLAKDNPSVDMAALAMSALQAPQQNNLSAGAKHWGYLLSLGAPPLGLVFAAWFYLSDKTDGKKAAGICLVLTGLSIIALVIMMKLFLSGAGVSPEQVQQIKPNDVRQLLE